MRNAKDAVVVLEQRGTRLALAGLCLAASAGAPLFAAEAQNPSTVEANRIGQSANADVQPDESDLVSQGGALYSPFSTAVDTAGSKPQVHSTPARRNADEGSPDIAPAAVTALVAAGLLVVLVRVLIAS